MNSRKVLTVVFFVVVLGMGYYSMNAAPVVNDEEYTYQGGLEWHKDPGQALDAAQAQDKPILVYYWTSWCTYCDTYAGNHYRDEAMREELDDYVLLAVNIDEPGSAEDLIRQHEATYPPQHRIMTSNGETVMSIEGYMEREQFRQVLESRSGSGSQ
jgi:thiol:disulfide interchange protein